MVWYDIASLFHAPSFPTAPSPQIGDSLAIPEELGITAWEHPTIIAAVRHCGCPFAESEVRALAGLANANPSLHVKVICMSAPDVAEPWFARIGGDTFEDQSRIQLLPDPTRALYAALGFGTLSWGGLFSGAMVTSLLELKKKGIVNTETGEGSYRWQNSGGIAVAKDGSVKWTKTAIHAGDICDYDEAVKSLLE